MTQIFRITHVDNLPFILQNGLLCPNAQIYDQNFVSIGFPSLIEYRKDRNVPIGPKGKLADYVPFYFWPKSPMLYVIYKGNDPEVLNTPQRKIIYLVSSFEALQTAGCRFVYTDRHAKLEYANFFADPGDKNQLNWDLIKTDQWGRQFGAERMEMKQAECLVYQKVSIQSIIGIAVYDEEIKENVISELGKAYLEIPVKIKPDFYF